ncbi:MAG: hypothetical protein DHS20C12_14900 [Pseudohongiella sp.]|nr:MAG: hypothetical protein DHS20C12_14900 [Pseudohongiella sp.]
MAVLLVTHPAIADVALNGIPDDEAGELPEAFATLKEGDGRVASAEDIQKSVADKVAGYRQLCTVKIVDLIPKSASQENITLCASRSILRISGLRVLGSPLLTKVSRIAALPKVSM